MNSRANAAPPALVVADESEKLGSAANNREGAANQKVETFAEWVRLSPASPYRASVPVDGARRNCYRERTSGLHTGRDGYV